jgi:hypothetical protein
VNDFLGRLAARTLGQVSVLRPDLATMAFVGVASDAAPVQWDAPDEAPLTVHPPAGRMAPVLASPVDPTSRVERLVDDQGASAAPTPRPVPTEVTEPPATSAEGAQTAPGRPLAPRRASRTGTLSESNATREVVTRAEVAEGSDHVPAAPPILVPRAPVHARLSAAGTSRGPLGTGTADAGARQARAVPIVRERARGPVGAAAGAETPRPIRVTIGRIDIRAAAPRAVQEPRSRAGSVQRPDYSLSDYLAARDRGSA